MKDYKSKPVRCERCGVCCGPYFTLYVEDEDIERWKKEGRDDIVERVEWEKNNCLWLGNKVYSLQTYREMTRCYYLKFKSDGVAECTIHHTKPKICRRYQPATSPLCRLYQGPYWD